mgnify:CR=1 FL=1
MSKPSVASAAGFSVVEIALRRPYTFIVMAMLILLAAWSGARWGELVALSRDRLDLERAPRGERTAVADTGHSGQHRATAGHHPTVPRLLESRPLRLVCKVW